jgi:hypothetical protein
MSHCLVWIKEIKRQSFALKDIASTNLPVIV